MSAILDFATEGNCFPCEVHSQHVFTMHRVMENGLDNNKLFVRKSHFLQPALMNKLIKLNFLSNLLSSS